MRDGYPVQTRLALAALVAIATGSAIVSYLIDGFPWTASELTIAATLGLMFVVAETVSIDVPSPLLHFGVSVGSILCLGAALSLPPLLAGATMLCATLVVDLSARLRPIKWIANAATLGLATFVASVVYRSLSAGAASPLDSYRALGAAIAASCIFALVNTLALSIIVAPAYGESPFAMWRENARAIVICFTLPLLGCFVPVLALAHPSYLLLLILPLGGAYCAVLALRNAERETEAAMIGMTDALELRDSTTSNHSVRVSRYVQAILDEMQDVPSRTKLVTIQAARIHDLGKIGIRDDALLKPGPLTDDERREMQRHPVIGADIVASLAMYRQGVTAIRHHHERWDGSGYPDQLSADQIPIGARIIAVADSYDAMTSDRPYRRALTASAALDELRRHAGSQFDPGVLDAFERAMSQPVSVPRSRTVAESSPAD